ncbi:hypothetical protein [Actinomadura sp. 7K507]|uniref:hypothetical protein n=1 Tax=Actinomadura sp. 7K507 TaxID=2530365 RepID=UPI001051E3EA|nr:hypothetical protein [Actinomadura sp. 7K507]TDC97723.1 hypothetical protein E1285_02550 [Actinomadura sp. 7K507]
MRRAVIRTRYGRRGRAEDPEYGIKNLLVKNLEHLTPGRFDKIMNRLHRFYAWCADHDDIAELVTLATTVSLAGRERRRRAHRRHQRPLRRPQPRRQSWRAREHGPGEFVDPTKVLCCDIAAGRGYI